jgi:1-deoxy-D-xylulose-5-phosphate synthase
MGTGLTAFAEKRPDRFFDVGIAESHAVVFAAGLAAGGMRPVVAVYASFLQRALDNVFHDVCLQKLPVIICADRAGVVEDGPTHHGIHDLAFLLNMPGLRVMAPRDDIELKEMLFAAYDWAAPTVIRYPRGEVPKLENPPLRQTLDLGRAEILLDGTGLAIWAAGKECFTALAVAKILKETHGVDAAVVNARFLKPFDKALLLSQAIKAPVASIEDCQAFGGLASLIDSTLIDVAHKGVKHFGWSDEPVPHGDVDTLRERFGMDARSIAAALAAWLPSLP